MTVKACCNQLYQKSRALLKKQIMNKIRRKILVISSPKADDASEVIENSGDAFALTW